jgi:hypothetical protein
MVGTAWRDDKACEIQVYPFASLICVQLAEVRVRPRTLTK